MLKLLWGAASLWVFELLVILMHECGHYITARVFRFDTSRPAVQFSYGWPRGGHVMLRGHVDSTLARVVAVVLAGPFVNAFFGLVAIGYMLYAGRNYFIEIFAALSLFGATFGAASDYRAVSLLMSSLRVHINFNDGTIKVSERKASDA